ncbi:UNVERIFIED_CONTAM: hypothetical protein RMT77_008393 [Armadillidium vulgare]
MDHSNGRSRRINQLVVGSSEVRMFMEGKELLNKEYGVDVRVEYKNGCTLDYCLGQVQRQMKPTTHLIIVWAITPYGWRRHGIRTRGKPEITIFRPAIYFSIRDIPRLMNQIVEYVYRINPKCLVYLAIPAIKDLYTFNQTRIVRTWGRDYRDFLKDHTDFNPKQMRKHSVYVYDQFASLCKETYYWEGKHLIYGNSALNCYIKKRPDAAHHKRRGVEHVNYLQGITNILNSDLLPDGLHGNQLFFKYYWIRNKSILNSIREINNIPPPFKPPVAPPRPPLLGDAPTVMYQNTDATRQLIQPTSTCQNIENAELPDRVSQILYSFTDLNQPSTSRGGFLSQGSFQTPTREEYIVSPYTPTQCITQMPSSSSFYQGCMPKSITNPPVYSSGFTSYDSDDADVDAGIFVRDFINERKRKGHGNTEMLMRDLDIMIKNVLKEQEIMKRRKYN